MKKNTGFTLIEIILVIVIVSIIAATSAKLLIAGGTAYNTSINTINAAWQGQIALERMVRDIRMIRSSNDITTASATQLVFVDSNGTTNTYTLTGTTLTLNGNVLADGISSLTLTYFDQNAATITTPTTSIRYVEIAINVTQGGANYPLQTGAYLRDAQ